MDETAIIQYINGAFGGVESVVTEGTTFFFCGVERKMPFATLITTDVHDQASNLNRPGVFRLNVGVTKSTYIEKFGPPPAFPTDGGTIDTGDDFTALNRLMPHPIYAAMHWVSVLNPSEATFETIKPLLAEAYEIAAKRQAKGTQSAQGA